MTIQFHIQLESILEHEGMPLPVPRNHAANQEELEEDLFARFCVQPVPRDQDGEPSMAVLLMTMFDLITKHKWTNESASDVWTILKALLPHGSDLGSYHIAERILKAHMDRSLVKVHSCVNDCLLFHDFEHPKLQEPRYQNGHRTKCPKCNEARYYGQKQPRKTIYFFPCRSYFQGISYYVFVLL
jgi:hypothetical protein